MNNNRKLYPKLYPKFDPATVNLEPFGLEPAGLINGHHLSVPPVATTQIVGTPGPTDDVESRREQEQELIQSEILHALARHHKIQAFIILGTTLILVLTIITIYTSLYVPDIAIPALSPHSGATTPPS